MRDGGRKDARWLDGGRASHGSCAVSVAGKSAVSTSVIALVRNSKKT